MRMPRIPPRRLTTRPLHCCRRGPQTRLRWVCPGARHTHATLAHNPPCIPNTGCMEQPVWALRAGTAYDRAGGIFASFIHAQLARWRTQRPFAAARGMPRDRQPCGCGFAALATPPFRGSSCVLGARGARITCTGRGCRGRRQWARSTAPCPSARRRGRIRCGSPASPPAPPGRR